MVSLEAEINLLVVYSIVSIYKNSTAAATQNGCFKCCSNKLFYIKFLNMKKLLFLLMGSTLLFACKKTPDTDELMNSFVVQTAKDPNANFTSYKTYYISDTIALRASNPNDTLWTDASAKQLIDVVKSNMNSRGYTFVGHGANPDLGLGMTAIKDLNIGVIYPGYWWGYWGGCYWGYCGYPPYYGYGAIYSIPTGTMILDMIDLKNASANAKLFVPWSSVMSGGLGNSGNDLQLGVEAINQAFNQSSYIQTH